MTGAGRRGVISAAIIAVVVLLIAVAAWVVKQASDDNADETKVVVPRNVTENGVPHPANAPAAAGAPVVEVYEDFLCSHCAEFEKANRAFLSDLADRGEISLRFLPMTIIDGPAETGPAHDAMNAAICVADEQGPEAFWTFKTALFRAGYWTGTETPSDSALSSLAKDAGISGIDDCVRTSRFVPWLNQARDTATSRGVSGTPTVLVDGTIVEDVSTDGLQRAINAASTPS